MPNALVSISKLQNVIPEFIDTRLMPSAPSTMKWILGGATFVILRRMDDIVSQYLPMLKTTGIVNVSSMITIRLTLRWLKVLLTLLLKRVVE